MKLSTWNVNSITVRLEQVLDWLKKSQTTTLALQETKITDDKFPLQAFTELGYQVAFSGQKSYNGVALISQLPITDVMMDLPHWPDPARRILAATIDGVRVFNLYVPNGAAVGTDKYTYKLAWLEAVTISLQEALADYSQVAVVGDFNIAPTDQDVHNPALWAGSVLVSPAERAAFARWQALGLHDCFRTLMPEQTAFSWWDYRAGGFQRNHGLRIDHILLSDVLQQRCQTCMIDKEPRKAARPSDHAPVSAVFIS